VNPVGGFVDFSAINVLLEVVKSSGTFIGTSPVPYT